MIHLVNYFSKYAKRLCLFTARTKLTEISSYCIFLFYLYFLPPPHRIRKMNSGSTIRTRLHVYTPAILHYYKCCSAYYK